MDVLFISKLNLRLFKVWHYCRNDFCDFRVSTENAPTLNTKNPKTSHFSSSTWKLVFENNFKRSRRMWIKNLICCG